MNDKNRRYLEAGQRCRQWIIDFVAFILPGSMFETKCTALTALVDELENLSGDVEAFTGEGLSATDVKGSERLDLLDIMEKARDAARAAEPDNPGRFGQNILTYSVVCRMVDSNQKMSLIDINNLA